MNFTISEFCILGKNIEISPVIADKILKHIEILQPIRDKLNAPIIISKHSGYRPYGYEIEHKRSGESEHCFFGKGAVDLTTRINKLDELLSLLRESHYKRVCYYPNQKFIHCDFKGYKKKFFVCSDGKDWVYQD